tara:strand:- start:4042 stop:4206 length:165 start_codon:yes stop_codon:yes gene_type:complete
MMFTIIRSETIKLSNESVGNVRGGKYGRMKEINNKNAASKLAQYIILLRDFRMG